jgi:GDP-mannose 6-dehydrogenase
MRVAVFGLGYVGSVTAAGLAERGHKVIGVDVSPSKVDAINAGCAPLIEPGLAELIERTVGAGLLHATTNAREAVRESDASLICVGTPSEPSGGISTLALQRVAQSIGLALQGRVRRHAVILRSTVMPGTAETIVIPILEEASGLSAGRGFGFALNPEFLREGTSLADFESPVKTVIGVHDSETADLVEALYEGQTGTVVRLPVRAAELAKYVDNAFHAVKVTFANEVGALCRSLDLDSHVVMESFFADTKLNISPAYLKPGFAFGGSCLPKDLRALLHTARHRDVTLPMLESVLVSNESCIARVVDTVLELGKRKVGVFGLSFKADTDDLRESPFVAVTERLLGRGLDLRIFDAQLSLAQLTGTNRDYIEDRIPHLSCLLAESPDEVLKHAEVCVVGAAEERTVSALAEANGHVVVDLFRLPDAGIRRGGDRYIGVAW